MQKEYLSNYWVTRVEEVVLNEVKLFNEINNNITTAMSNAKMSIEEISYMIRRFGIPKHYLKEDPTWKKFKKKVKKYYSSIYYWRRSLSLKLT
jgi:hypothetical protein